MNPGIYFDTSESIVRQKELTVISQNLANLSTPGYKRDRISFSRYLSSVIERRKIDFSEGDLKPTGNPLDIAISGKEDAFFVVKTPEGEFYTRRGDLTIDKDRRLITRNGFPVQGMRGDIFIKGNKIEISEDGKVLVDGKMIDKLKVVSLPLDKLIRYGRSLFYIKDDYIPQSSSNHKIFQGYLEESNVKPIEEVARMVDCLRNYEICQKSIQSQDETTSRLINDVGIVRI